MNEPEHQIAFFKDMLVPDNSEVRYDLYFTDKRLLVINLGKKSKYASIGGGGLIGVLISEAVYAIDSKRKDNQLKKNEEKLTELSLDVILETNKENFAIRYAEIQQMWLRDPKSRWRKREFIIKTGEFEVYFVPTEEQFRQLLQILPNINSLSKKLIFPDE